MTIRHLDADGAREEAARFVKELTPYSEDEARKLAQHGELFGRRLDSLEALDSLDWLMTGVARGCHYGAHDTEPYDISWRTP